MNVNFTGQVSFWASDYSHFYDSSRDNVIWSKAHKDRKRPLVGFHLYENFDNKPPIIANKNDLGVSTSLGWNF